MALNQTIRGDKTARASLWSGTVVALVALIGVDCAVIARTTADRGHKSAIIAVRSVAPAAMAARTTTARLVLAGATSLLILLLLNRQVSCLPQKLIVAPLRAPSTQTRPPRLLRKAGLAYHTGGLYGP
jgi:hypothetical protein